MSRSANPNPDPDPDPDLAPLADVPAPRRTEDAFARGVVDGVRKRRARTTWFALPALAAATAAFVFVIARPGPTTDVEPVPVRVAVAPPAADIIVTDPFDDDDALFALPMLDGSSDEELARLDAVLDEKLRAQRGER